MSPSVSLSVLAGEVEATRARLASMEAKLDELLVALANHHEDMREMFRLAWPVFTASR